MAGAQVSGLASTLGFRFVEVEMGRIRIDMPVHPQLYNTMNYLHGGAIAALADTAIGMSHATTLREDESSATVEIKVSFLRPVFGGTVQAVGYVVKRGRTLSHVECEIHNNEGKLVAKASGTMMVLRGDAAEGR